MVIAATPVANKVTKAGVEIPKSAGADALAQHKEEQAGNPPQEAPKAAPTMVVKPQEAVDPQITVLCLEDNLVRFGKKWIPLYKGRKVQMSPEAAEYLSDLNKVKIVVR